MKTRAERRQTRIRAKVQGTNQRPRLSVFRSNKHIYAQLIDDAKRETLTGASEVELKSADKIKKTDKAKELGLLIAKKAAEKKVKTVVFDKGSYKYHGRVKAVAEGAREGGLKF
jgi:large subunit ribosomal protein L18